MDLIFIGIFDIIILILFGLSIYFGYKKGLMNKSLSLMGALVFIIISFMLCDDLANFLINNDIIHPKIYSNIEGNIIEGIYDRMGSDVPISELSVSDIVHKILGLPGFIADIVVDGVGNPSATEMVSSISNYLSKILMCIISFFIILLSLFVFCLILKIFVNILRKSAFIRVVDGILGSLLYLSFTFVLLYVLFALLNPIVENAYLGEGFSKFIIVDLQLHTGEFRFSKLFYENNILVNLFKIIF